MKGKRSMEGRTPGRRGSHSISLSVGEGVDTSFDDVLDIVVPYATWLIEHGCIWHTRGFLPLRSHRRYNGLSSYSGAQQSVSGPAANLVWFSSQ